MSDRVQFFAAESSLSLNSAPIPAGWIRQGNPQASAARLWGSDDRTALALVWDCTAGVFDWHYTEEETVHILEGEVHIEIVGGVSFRLGPGDTAVFRRNAHAVWTIPSRVRKVAICRKEMPFALTFPLLALRKLRMLATSLRRRERPLVG